MIQMWNITRRETFALFYSPIAYVALACFIFMMGIIFAAAVFHPGAPSDLRDVFNLSRFALFFVTPLITMGLFSEEFKSGRIEMLRTSPISASSLVFGKFLGGFAFYAAMVASLLVFVLTLTFFGGPDYHMVAASFIGLFFMGALYVAVGLFFSACTESQLIAVVGAFLTLALLNLAGDVPSWFGGLNLWPWLRISLTQATIGVHIADFAKGVIDTAHIIYFVTTAGLFIFLTYLVMESRNWRR